MIDSMNLNKYNLQVGQTVIYEGKESILKDFIDELVCVVEVDKPTCYTRPKETFINRIYLFFRWPQDMELIYDTYRGEVKCSIYNLTPKDD